MFGKKAEMPKEPSQKPRKRLEKSK